MIAVKIFNLVLFSIIFSGCSLLTLPQSEPPKKFKVENFWVKDTLVKANKEFRKVNRMTPVIYKDSIVIGNAFDGLVSYNLTTKNINWRTLIPFGVEASGAVIKDRLFVGSNNGKMYSIDLSNGSIVWAFDTKSELVSEPLLNDGILYFLSGSQTLYAVDAATGSQLWINNRQDTSSTLTIRGGSKPAIDNGIIYAGFSDGSLVAFNAKTGTTKWEITLNRNTKFKDIDAAAVVDEDFIYINSFDDKIYCLAKNKGEIIWAANYGGFSTPLLTKDKIFVSSSKGELAALSKKDGSVIWVKNTKKGVFTEPILNNNILITGESQGKLLFMNTENGNILGSFEPGRGVFSKPSFFESSYYFISGEGNIYGLKAEYNNKSSIYYLR